MSKMDQPRAPSRIKKRAENGRTGQTGTAFAIIDRIPSCGHSPTKGTWGGARNDGKKPSWHLSLENCLDLIEAGDLAEAIGLRFNRHWIVHYAKAGIDEHDAMRFIGRLLKLAGDYARRHGGRLAAIWVREGGPGKGGHVHILMHLSTGLSLRGRSRRWIGLAGGRCVHKVSRVRPVAGIIGAAEGDSEHYRHNVGNVRRYLLKNVDVASGRDLGLKHKGQSGLIVGKRCGWTQNIGKSERSNRKRRTESATQIQIPILLESARSEFLQTNARGRARAYI